MPAFFHEVIGIDGDAAWRYSTLLACALGLAPSNKIKQSLFPQFITNVKKIIFDTGSHYVTLTDLELGMYIRLASKETHLTLPPKM